MSAPRGSRRRLLQGGLIGATAVGATGLGIVGAPAWAAGPASAPEAADAEDVRGRRVLRVVFLNAETSFDPARIADIYSRAVTAHIFEGLYTFDLMAPGAPLRPLTAEALPEVSDDFRRFRIRVRPGIHFTDHPAFRGRPRELVAADYVYAILRVADPANLSPLAADLLALGIRGLKAAVSAAGRPGARLDYDQPVEGLQAIDRHTLEIRLDQPRPRLAFWLADSGVFGAVAREVVEHHGDTIGEHPVGTGPFVLGRWRRSSLIVLRRNPAYRRRLWEEAAQPAPDDAAGQAIAQRLAGRTLPLLDEVRISIIEEFQPQWLSLLNGQIDALAGTTGELPSQFSPVAMPGGQLAPNLARRGMQAQRNLGPDVVVTFFNFDHPMVGGTEPQQVALRRAIALAYDAREEVRVVRKGQAILAQSIISPHVSGYDPAFRSEMSEHDPARANALLDLYGYRDRDGDGWRERPDGSPLELEIASEPEQIYRAYNELWQKALRRVGIRVRFKTQQWAENLKAAEAGTLMMWSLGGIAASPDGLDSLARCYGPNIGSGNYARMRLPAFDRLYEQLQRLPDGPERERLFAQAKRLTVAYMPYKARAHRVQTDLLHPWVIGFRRPVFASEWFHLVDVDVALRDRYLTA